MINRYDIDMVERGNGLYVLYSDHLAEVSGLQAARMAYASEFPLNADGEPDVGSIHENIRKLKAEVQRLEAHVEALKQACISKDKLNVAVNSECIGLRKRLEDIMKDVK